MTLDEIEKMNAEFLDILTVSKYLNKNPQQIRESIAKGVPWAYALGTGDFKIPKRAFVHCHKHGFVNDGRRSAGLEQREPTHSFGAGHFDMQDMVTRLSEISRQVNVIMRLMENTKRVLKE
jgi:hypothetical protein